MLMIVGVSVIAARCDIHLVVDSVSGMPLAKASVFDSTGRLIGVCDDRGVTPMIGDTDYPVSVRHVGYGPALVRQGDDKNVRLREVPLELPEVVISSARQQVMRLKAYVREYSTLLNDQGQSVLLFREKMVDYMIPLKETKHFDGWLKPRLLAVRNYYHFTNGIGLDSVSNFYPRHFSWSDWIGIPRSFMLPKSMRNDDENRTVTDTVRGRVSNSEVWRRQGKRLYVDVDILTDSLNRRWIPDFRKSFFNDVDFTEMQIQYVFDDISGDRVYPWDLSRMSYNIMSNGIKREFVRRSFVETAQYMDTYAEVYIVDREIITVKEARNLDNKLPDFEGVFMVPNGVPELQPSILALVERVNSIDHDAVRLGIEADQRLGKGEFDPESHTLLGKIRTLFGYKKSKYKKKVRNESEETKAFRKRFGIGDIDD